MGVCTATHGCSRCRAGERVRACACLCTFVAVRGPQLGHLQVAGIGCSVCGVRGQVGGGRIPGQEGDGPREHIAWRAQEEPPRYIICQALTTELTAELGAR